jgi:hypothetical protein
MSKPYTPTALSDNLDTDLIWRRQELSDMKLAVRKADSIAQPVLLRAIIAMSYAHWEGYIRTCASQYFEHLTLRRMPFAELERQIYVNSFLNRLDALHRSRMSLRDRCRLVNDILDGAGARFSFLNPELIDTRSNLGPDVIIDICIICGFDAAYFQDNRIFLERLLKRRNAIAHGRPEFIKADEIDGLVTETLALMSNFRTLVENKVYTRAYAA